MSFNPNDGFVAVAPPGDADGLDELPIFNVERAQMAFSVTAEFVAAQIANNVMILALSNGRILRIDLKRPEDIDGTLPHAPDFSRAAEASKEEPVADYCY
jgi:hypothetical protein